MKIRHPWLIKLLAFVGVWLIRLWMATIRHHIRQLGETVHPRAPGLKQRFIYAFWHENILIPCSQYAGAKAKILVSQHADGEYIAQICRFFRLGIIRGSTTRGGMKAVRQLVRASARCHLAVIPDGPRGPRRQVQPGLIYLASRTGLPIVVFGIGFCRPWRMKSWDRFAIPRPGSLAVTVAAPPIVIPPDVDKVQIEEYRLRVEGILSRLTTLAEQWAETGRWPGLDAVTAADLLSPK